MRVQPLHSAAAVDATETARLLLDAGADPNAEQQGGFRPIDAAVQNGNDELYDLLVERGADSEARPE
jgi:ankyrin repeat protein